jgi:hypothetical protein
MTEATTKIVSRDEALLWLNDRCGEVVSVSLRVSSPRLAHGLSFSKPRAP